MAKFYGEIGFIVESETSPGVWTSGVTKRNYYGDLIRNSRRLQSGDTLNDSIVVSNEISIIADPFAYENFHSIRYVKFMGTKWKVANVNVQFPRLILTLGEIYNGN